MLVYRLCISVLLTRELHLIGLSQINTRWSVTSLVLTRCLRDYVNVFSMIYLLPVVFMLLVQVQVIDWKDQLLGMTLSYNLLMTTLSLTHTHHYTKLNSTQCVALVPRHRTYLHHPQTRNVGSSEIVSLGPTSAALFVYLFLF